MLSRDREQRGNVATHSSHTAAAGGNSVATLAPPVKSAQTVSPPQSELREEPKSEPEIPGRESNSPVVSHDIPPITPRPVSPGSYAEPILPEAPVPPEPEPPVAPAVSPAPTPQTPVPGPVMKGGAPPATLPEDKAAVAPPFPDDVVEPDADLQDRELPPHPPEPPAVPEPPKSPAPAEASESRSSGAAPPPASPPLIPVPKTQPIQIKRSSPLLPPDRVAEDIVPPPPPVSERASDSDLPRLDVSLAEGDSTATLPTHQQSQPTRIQLPQLGDEEVHADSPNDFTVAPGPTESAVAPETDSPPPESHLDYPTEGAASPVEDSGGFVPPDAATASTLEEQLLRELSSSQSSSHAEAPPVDPAIQYVEELPPQPVSAVPKTEPVAIRPPEVGEIDEAPQSSQSSQEPTPTIAQPELHEPEETSSTHEGSVANMLRVHEGAPEASVSSELGFDSVTEPGHVHGSTQSRISYPSPSSAPTEEPAPAPLSPVSHEQSKSEMDAFDELLGKSSSTGGIGPSWGVLGAIVLSVAVIAAAMAYVLWRSLSGGPDPFAGQDRSALSQKYAVVPHDRNSHDVVEAAKTLNITPPSKTAEKVKKAEKSEDKGKELTAPAPSSIALPPGGAAPDGESHPSPPTLPGDGNKIIISDGGGNHANPSALDSATGSATRPPSKVGTTSADSAVARPSATGNNNPPPALSKSKKPGEPSSPNSLSALDRKIAEMSEDPSGPADAPAVRDAPAQVRKADAPAVAPDPISTTVGNAASFPAPGPKDGPIGKARELIDVYMRAPNWQARIPYTYQGDSLKPAIEEYYKKWPFSRSDKFSVQLFQIEDQKALGGPYWVYLVSANDSDPGFPIIVRVEDGKLKVDWEIYSEFQDRHFVKFQDGTIASPHNFRVVLEQKSDYFGPDRDTFTDRDDYLCFEVSPPYGSPGEFSQFAFVKKGTPLAEKLNKNVGLGEDLLAVLVTLDYKVFPHGVKHLVITKWITEGWFE